jgi:hypothetical protein
MVESFILNRLVKSLLKIKMCLLSAVRTFLEASKGGDPHTPYIPARRKPTILDITMGSGTTACPCSSRKACEQPSFHPYSDAA